MINKRTALLTSCILPNGLIEYVWETVLEETISTHNSKFEALRNIPQGFRTDRYNLNSVVEISVEKRIKILMEQQGYVCVDNGNWINQYPVEEAEHMLSVGLDTETFIQAQLAKTKHNLSYSEALDYIINLEE